MLRIMALPGSCSGPGSGSVQDRIVPGPDSSCGPPYAMGNRGRNHTDELNSKWSSLPTTPLAASACQARFPVHATRPLFRGKSLRMVIVLGGWLTLYGGAQRIAPWLRRASLASRRGRWPGTLIDRCEGVSDPSTTIRWCRRRAGALFAPAVDRLTVVCGERARLALSRSQYRQQCGFRCPVRSREWPTASRTPVRRVFSVPQRVPELLVRSRRCL